MPEGRRYTPESPSPAMVSFANFIKGKGYDDSTPLETTVAATFIFHRDWQAGHAEEVRQEREANAGKREAEKAAKAAEREANKQKKAEEKALRDQEKADKKAQKEAEKAERDAKAEQEGETNGAEAGEPRKRLRLKKDDAEQETATASAGTF